MAKTIVTTPTNGAAALLHVADFLARPQRFLAVAEARAGLRETLEQAQTGSVILTNNGVPAAAILPFATLEEIRQAVMRLLVDEMASSLKRTQAVAQALPSGEPTSEAELETLARTAVRRARRSVKPSALRRSGRR